MEDHRAARTMHRLPLLLACLVALGVTFFRPTWVIAAPGYVTRQAITLPAISAGPSRAPLHFVVNMPTPAPDAHSMHADANMYDAGDLKTVTAQHDVTVVVTVTNTHHQARPTVSTTVITHTATQPVTTTHSVQPSGPTTTRAPTVTSTTAASGCATTIYNNCGNGCNCNGVDNGVTTTITATATSSAVPAQSPQTTRRTKTRVVTNTRTVFSGPTVTVNENGPTPTTGSPPPVTLVVNLPDSSAAMPTTTSSTTGAAEGDLAFACGNRTFSYIAEGASFQTAVNACSLAEIASSAEMVCISNAIHAQQMQYDGVADFVWVAAWEGAASDHLALMPAPSPASGSLNTIPDGAYGRVCEGDALAQSTNRRTTTIQPTATARITTTITTSSFPTNEITIEGQQPVSNLHIVVEEDSDKSWARKWLW